MVFENRALVTELDLVHWTQGRDSELSSVPAHWSLHGGEHAQALAKRRWLSAAQNFLVDPAAIEYSYARHRYNSCSPKLRKLRHGSHGPLYLRYPRRRPSSSPRRPQRQAQGIPDRPQRRPQASEEKVLQTTRPCESLLRPQPRIVTFPTLRRPAGWLFRHKS